MNAISPISAVSAATSPSAVKPAGDPALRKVFDEFVGETFFGEMLKAMRKSQGEVAYLGGGQAEQIFTQQLDQALTKKMTNASANKLSGPMYQLFTQQRR